MAAVTRDLGGFNNGQVKVTYTFDDVSGLISDVTTINNGTRGTLTYVITDPDTGTNLFNTPSTANANSGTTHHNVSGLNILMLFEEGTGRGAGTFGWVLPFDVTLSWSSR